MPKIQPISTLFVPLTWEAATRVGGRINGCLDVVAHPFEDTDGWALFPDDSSDMVYTHPTLFQSAEEVRGGHTYNVRVWLENDRLRMGFTTRNHGDLLKDTPVFEANPVTLSHVSLKLVLKLFQLTEDGSRCAMGQKCEGARFSELDPYRTALVMIESGEIAVMCRKCCIQGLQDDYCVPYQSSKIGPKAQCKRGSHLVLLCGWNLPPRAPVTTWVATPTERIALPQPKKISGSFLASARSFLASLRRQTNP